MARTRSLAVYVIVLLPLSFLAFLLTTVPITKAYLPSYSSLLSQGNSGLYHPLQNLQWHSKPGRPIRVAITETGGSHDEVVGALINLFGVQPDVKLELFQEWQRYKSKDIFDHFELSNPLPLALKPNKFMAGPDDQEPDILISTTCDLDAAALHKAFGLLLERERTYLFCVVHHADRWNHTKHQRILMPWVEKGLVDFVTLSEHTSRFLQEHAVPSWNLSANAPVTVRTLPPVFPIKPEHTLADTELAFALQGDYDPRRRNYTSIFEHLGNFLASSQGAQDPVLHLIGHSPNGKLPKVPAELKPHVVFDDSVSYPVFYGILSQAFALLPAFASDTYYDRKASSTVPASLIAGVPLVATRKLVETYSYIREEHVWLQEEDEEDFDVIGRVLAMTPTEREAKKLLVEQRRDELITENTAAVKTWMSEALAKLDDPPS